MAWYETKERCWLKEAEVSVMSFILEDEAAAGHFSHFLIVSSLQKGNRFLILSHLSCPLHHPGPLPTILQVIIWFHDPQQPRWSNHLDNKWGSGSTSPVVLFLSSPVSLIIAKSSIPVSLGLGETKKTQQHRCRPLQEYKLKCCLASCSSCFCSLWRRAAPVWIHIIFFSAKKCLILTPLSS